jgi:hypothetical protein
VENPIINGIVEALSFIIGIAVIVAAGLVYAVPIYYLSPLAWHPSFLLGLCCGGATICFAKGYFESRGFNRAKRKGSSK